MLVWGTLNRRDTWQSTRCAVDGWNGREWNGMKDEEEGRNEMNRGILYYIQLCCSPSSSWDTHNKSLSLCICLSILLGTVQSHYNRCVYYLHRSRSLRNGIIDT